MRSRLLLFPAAIVASASAPAVAYDYMTLKEAQQQLFPGATFTPKFVKMTDAQILAVMKESGVSVWNREVKAWKVSTGGWFFLDQVLGRDDRITYAVGLDDNGVVTGIEILVCVEVYGAIREPLWRAEFVGLRKGQVRPGDTIDTISGVSLSSDHVAEGVRRLLSTYDLVLTPKTG